MYVVIGGSDGLGKEIVLSINKTGAKVLNISRSKNNEASDNALCDLSTQVGTQNAINHIKELKEKIEAIIISAGVFSFHDIDNLDFEEFERTFSINTRAPFLIVSALIERIQADNADVIFINSVAGINSYEHQTLYNASKAALHSFTKDLRVKLEKTSSRVIGIYPGMIDTDLAQKLPGGHLPKSKHTMIDPKALAEYIVYTQRLPKSMEVSDLVINRKK